jgi:serine protease Do
MTRVETTFAFIAFPALLWSAPLDAQVAVRQDVRNRDDAFSAGADTITAAALSAAFRSATDRTLPAVVFIAVEQASPSPRPDQSERMPEEWREYFRMPRQEQRRDGTGSGFIIDANGYILTNNHVIADAGRLTVRLRDGREYSARLVGNDIYTDLALIKIDAHPGDVFPVAPLGNSDDLRVGDWVLALGSPLGLDFTVTAGIVSAQGRQISDGVESFIQTDAAINPGNSGGPLIDLYGRVVGINSAIFGTNRFIGYGFAVPINIARRVIGDLREFGYLRRPLLGVEVRSVSAVDAEAFALKEVRGVFVSAVTPKGPASNAGLRAGDIVLSIDGTELRDDAHFMTSLADARPGNAVSLGILRHGKPENIPVTLGEFPRPSPPPAPAPEKIEESEQLLGFTVRDRTEADQTQQKYQGDYGVVVARVIQHSGAFATGYIRPGTIVLEVNGKRLRTAEDVTAITKQIKAGTALSAVIFDSEVGERVVTFRARY